MVKGLIFDFWGTLVENGIHPSPVNQVKYILRLRMPFKEFVVRFEEAMMTKEYNDLNEAFTAVCEAFQIRPNPHILDRLIGMWNKNELLGKPFFETIDVMQSLKKKGLKIGLISNTNPTIHRVIEKYNLGDLFDTQVLSYKEGILKTDPKMFDMTVKSLGLKKDDVVMIGDSMQTDMLGAREAGLRAILVDRMNKRDYHPKVRNLRELQAMIEDGSFDEFASQEPTPKREDPPKQNRRRER
ncbi:HAD family hydrolase [Candidatus Woesearchaeota archaeon]|nr:HAD family hydrolase [Candidatus Woesearchaeota archaeon]